jgi:hypothetical protein
MVFFGEKSKVEGRKSMKRRVEARGEGRCVRWVFDCCEVQWAWDGGEAGIAQRGIVAIHFTLLVCHLGLPLCL